MLFQNIWKGYKGIFALRFIKKIAFFLGGNLIIFANQTVFSMQERAFAPTQKLAKLTFCVFFNVANNI